jgi:hypothetical protein
MGGIAVARKYQLGREATAGTPVAATTVWRGPAGMPVDSRTRVRPAENVGLTAQTSRQYTPKLLSAIPFAQTEATFEQLLHVLEGGIKTATLSKDGAGDGYIGVYDIPYGTTPNTLKTYTIQGGDNQQEEVAEYCFVLDYTLEGKVGEAWKITANWQARQNALGTYTPGLSIPTVEEMKFGLSKFYIDAVGGTIGTTQLQNTVIGAKLHVVTGWQPRFTGDGMLYFNVAEWIGAKIDGELTMLHNASSVAEKVFARADTPRQMRWLIEGTSFSVGGTAYQKKTHKADLALLWTDFPEPNAEDQGAAIVTAKFEGVYDATANLFCQHTHVTDLSAVP